MLLLTDNIIRIISGASAGSLVAALICTTTDEDMKYAFDSGYWDLDFFSYFEGDVTVAVEESTKSYKRMLGRKHSVIDFGEYV